MKTLTDVLPTVLELPTSKGDLATSASPNGLPPQSRSSQKTEPLEDGRAEADVAQFTAALSQACIALRQYGKTPAELRALRDMFLAALADIPVKALTKALFVHLNTSDEIPTPRQLREIVFPPKPVWKPDWYVYSSLKKKIYDGYFPLSDERQFMRDCESYAMEKRGREMEEYENAKREIGSHIRMIEQADGVID